MTADAAGWRSLHFVPAGSDKMLAKAPSLGADALILDLEDSVPPEHKQDARERAVRWLEEIASTSASATVVRINPFDTQWGRDDLAAVVPAGPDALCLPKVESAADLADIDEALGSAERAAGIAEGTIGVLPIATETPKALLRVEEIATGPRVCALTWGAEDLSAALGGRRNRDDDGKLLGLFSSARWSARLAAAAAGVPAIDGVHVDFRDAAGLERECAEAVDVGFSGKLTIHPSQIEIVNCAFTPSAADIAENEALLEAYESHRSSGRGAFTHAGTMVDEPHLARARALLARARQHQRHS